MPPIVPPSRGMFSRGWRFAQRMFAEEGRFWTLMCLVTGLVSILKGLRLPNAWSATQAQCGYELGFIKRGLFGAAAAALGAPIHRYDVFAVVSFVILLVFMTMFGAWLARNPLFQSPSGQMLVAVFASSFAVSTFVYCVGYLDILLGVMVMAIVMCGRWWLAFAASVVFAALGILIHEIYLLAVWPLSVLGLSLDMFAEARPLRRWSKAGLLAIFAAFAAGLTVFVSNQGLLSGECAGELRELVAARVDFPVRDIYFQVFERGGANNLTMMKSFLSQPGMWGHLILPYAVMLLPSGALFFAVTLRLLRRDFHGWRLLGPLTATLVTSLSPLLLIVAGWDMQRWYAWATFSSFMALTVVAARVKRDAGEPLLGVAQRNLCVLLIALNMASSGELMDDRQLDTYPFQLKVLKLLIGPRE